MKIFWFLAFIVFSAIAFMLHIGGVFDTVALSRNDVGPFFLVYRFERGHYDEMKFVVNDVERYLRSSHSIHSSKGFAIFYDNPGTTVKDNLRSIVGCIVDSMVDVVAPYQTAVYRRTDAVIGAFPIRSFFSYTTGLFKFSSRLDKYVETNKLSVSGPVMEVYDAEKKQIFYIASVGTESPVPPIPGK